MTKRGIKASSETLISAPYLLDLATMYPVQNVSNISSDTIHRVQTSINSNNLVVTSTSTEKFTRYIFEMKSEYAADIALLRSVIIWLRKKDDYNGIYTAFLLGCLSEEEFESESDKFMIYEEDVNPKKIAKEIDRLYELTAMDFDTSDYADYFKCPQKNIMDGLRLLFNPIFVERLPKNPLTRDSL